LQPPDGFPPALCIAAAVGNVSIVKLLLQYGESLDQHDDDGWNPLHLAVEGGFVDVVATIVDHICNEKCYNVLNDLNKNKTPMNLAIDGGKENIIKLLKSVNALKAETEKKNSLQCIDKVCQESEMRESHSVNDVLEEANALKHETIERKKEAHNFMSEWNEKVENEIQQKKEQANALFKAQSFNKAVDLYKEALSICPEINETQQVRAILYSNLSSTYRRLGNFEEALKAGLKVGN
jgi:tetratricopeptide (TPR) repeat protein